MKKKVWKVSKLGEVCNFYNGQAHEKNIDADGDYIVVNSKFISSDGNIYKKTSDVLSPLLRGDITMVMSDVPNGKAIAKCFLVDKDNMYTLNQRICAIRSTSFENKYLYYQLNRNTYFLNFDNGENQTNLRKNDILNCPLLIPPLIEQQRIVAILDETFDNIAMAKENAEKNLKNVQEMFETYLQSVFINYGDAWVEKKLEEVCDFQNGFAFKSKDAVTVSNTQLIRMGNLYHNQLDLDRRAVYYPDDFAISYKKYILKENDLIISLTGTTGKQDYGYTVKIPKTENNLLLNQRIAKIDIIDESRIIREYLLHFLLSKTFLDVLYKTANGTRQANISTEIMKKLIIKMPNVIEQQSIVDKLDALSTQTQKLKAIYTQKLDNLEKLKKSILQKAFNGEL